MAAVCYFDIYWCRYRSERLTGKETWHHQVNLPRNYASIFLNAWLGPNQSFHKSGIRLWLIGELSTTPRATVYPAIERVSSKPPRVTQQAILDIACSCHIFIGPVNFLKAGGSRYCGCIPRFSIFKPKGIPLLIGIY